MTQTHALILKKCCDCIVSSALLVLFAPLMAIVALAIRIRLGLPIFFRQERIGYHGKTFIIYKFRTMSECRNEHGDLLPDEKRLTRFGQFLRRSTLDELPELINVLKGEMSLVGPRPLLVEYRALYTAQQWRRHEMPPGMAGSVLAGGRNALAWEEKFALDVWYVDNWSIGLDLKILLLTAWKVLNREGVSAQGHATVPKFEGSSGASGQMGRVDR